MKQSSVRVTLPGDIRDDLINLKALRAGLSTWGALLGIPRTRPQLWWPQCLR